MSNDHVPPGSPPHEKGRMHALLAFLQSAERLKDTLRSGRTAMGRPESTAEHTWRLCLLAMLLERDLPGVDHHRLLKICMLHDLGEAISGDVPAPAQGADDGRHARERDGFEELCSELPRDLHEEFLELYDDYAQGRSIEAQFAKGLDKLETMLQHVAGKNAPGFDYAFNLGYGIEATSRHPLLVRLRRIVDEETRISMTGPT
ncbi:MAG: HD domain-containing protein [Erythrobacter sp.]|nr:HD domain-containing protein [Erythrobacter sp.]